MVVGVNLENEKFTVGTPTFFILFIFERIYSIKFFMFERENQTLVLLLLLRPHGFYTL